RNAPAREDNLDRRHSQPGPRQNAPAADGNARWRPRSAQRRINMSTLQLLARNLFYHWRGNFAVFLGITLGSAVLTGALLVGDSLYGSLRALTLDQLGWVEQAMLPGRFFRAELAKEIEAGKRAPVVLLQGSAAIKEHDVRV